MQPKLPRIPEPTEVEIELTNGCNARCTACPRNDLQVPRGLIDPGLYRAIIDQYAALRKTLQINQLRGSQDFPFLTFAGLGEPLLHPQAPEMIAYAAERGFKTVLFTNASRLERDTARRLLESGIRDVYVSFWGIEKGEYEPAMKIPFETSLRNVEVFAAQVADHGIRLLVTWVDVEEIHSTEEEIRRFWQDRGIGIDIDDEQPENQSATNAIWNRGGSLDTVAAATHHEIVDFDLDFWCSQLYFTDTICWDGDVILCSQDYFRKNVVLGNLRHDTPGEIARRKAELLAEKVQHPICVRCRKPRDYSIATHPWDAILPEWELRRYRYDLRNVLPSEGPTPRGGLPIVP